MVIRPMKTIEQYLNEYSKKFIKHKLFGKGKWGFEVNDELLWISYALTQQKRELLEEFAREIKNAKRETLQEARDILDKSNNIEVIKDGKQVFLDAEGVLIILDTLIEENTEKTKMSTS